MVGTFKNLDERDDLLSTIKSQAPLPTIADRSYTGARGRPDSTPDQTTPDARLRVGSPGSYLEHIN